MFILVVDVDPNGREAVRAKLEDAARQAGIKRVEIGECDPDSLSTLDLRRVAGYVVGPATFPHVDSATDRIKSFAPEAFIGVVLDNEVYATQAVALHRALGLRIMPIGDTAQLASYLMECDARKAKESRSADSCIIGVAQLKGGVGATTVAAALASCYARHGIDAVAIDLCDVNPQLTEWARVGVTQRSVVAELLSRGHIPANRLNELLHPVEGYGGNLTVVGQPERYNSSFHFKADVLEGAPSSEVFMTSLFDQLEEEFEVVIIDFGMSWGVATFASLPRCEYVLLITDDDGMSVRRTLDGLVRFKGASSDPDEFDLDRWCLVLNGYTGHLISPKDLAAEAKGMGIFSDKASLFTLPFSERGRQWGAPGQSFFDLAEDSTKEVLCKIATSFYGFEHETQEAPLVSKLKQKLMRS